jgi:ferredoxin like protein
MSAKAADTHKTPSQKLPSQKTVKVEEKLFQNRYLVDEGRPHIVLNPDKAKTPSRALVALTACCPAGCYTLEEDGSVSGNFDGCLECGTCRVMTQASGDLVWNYPRGGYGVAYKFG